MVGVSAVSDLEMGSGAWGQAQVSIRHSLGLCRVMIRVSLGLGLYVVGLLMVWGTRLSALWGSCWVCLLPFRWAALCYNLGWGLGPLAAGGGSTFSTL